MRNFPRYFYYFPIFAQFENAVFTKNACADDFTVVT